MKLSLRILLIIPLLALSSCLSVTGPQTQEVSPGPADILIADFEGPDYGDWKVTGKAFGPGPARGTLPNQMKVTGYEGKGLVNSYFGRDDSKGMLVSPPFKIERRHLNFLIGGGMDRKRLTIKLVVDGKTVHSATGPNARSGGSEELEWKTWDLSKLQGKQARIRIADRKTGGWGHINIDHIVQSNKEFEVKLEDYTRSIRLTERYLHFPVKHKASKRLLKVQIGGKSVREFDIEIAESEVDYWVFLDTREFSGKTAVLRLPQLRGDKRNPLDRITKDAKIRDEETFYKEKLRQQFHFSSKRGWNNDPNGMVYYKGEYHLFYQHNPYGWAWGNMTWGHAVSKDMVHWTELDDAIHPDEMGTIYSGSAVIDKKNSAGFKTGDEDPIVCFYTSSGGRNKWSKEAGNRFTQSIAYSNDRGRTLTKYEGNPIIPYIAKGNRDPKVIWHEPTRKWVMVLYLVKKELAFFTSDNLKDWTETSRIKPFHECPELFELPVDGDPGKKKWVVYGANGDYYVGSFDGRTFKPDGELIKFHHGDSFYASQCFNNMPDDRQVQIAWGRAATPGMPFNQCMMFPVTLSLHTTADGIRMFAYPIREIRSLYTGGASWETMPLRPGENLLDGYSGDLFDIEATIDVGDAERVGFNIRGLKVEYRVKAQELRCGKMKAKLALKKGLLRLRILVDVNTVEIFAAGGQVYMPMKSVVANRKDKSIGIYATGGPAEIISLHVRELKSAWPD